MTDRFEDAVRDAARGLSAGTSDLPTYHDAWQRGRRRRIIKRSALAAAGVLVFVAALSVNLGRLPGSDSTETDDVAVSSVKAATPAPEPTAVPTTAQVESPDSTAPPVVAIPTAPAPPSQDEPTPIPAPATVAPTPAPAAQAQPTAEPTAAPTAVATPVESPTAEPAAPEPTAEPVTLDPEPSVTREPDQPGDSTLPDNTGAAGTGPAELPPGDATPDGLPELPEVAFTTAGVGQPASAIVLEPTAPGQLACDITGDGTADAQCELLPDYGCVADGEAQPGYVAIDTDEDGSIDTCSAVGITVCDTSADGLGDTPCIIEIDDTTEDGEAPVSDE